MFRRFFGPHYGVLFLLYFFAVACAGTNFGTLWGVSALIAGALLFGLFTSRLDRLLDNRAQLRK